MRHPLLDKIRAGHLNDEQKKAVCTLQGKILILAGAGSGKTSTLAYRMAYLIENASVPPSAILGLTFTNKAAQEMRERIAKILPKEKVQPLTLCTFHSFCMQVLKENIERLGYTKRFSLYDEQDVKRLIAQLAQSLLDHEGQLPSLEETLYLLKEKQQKGDSPLPYSSQWHKQFVENLHQHLEMTLRAYNAVDFDSLISLTVKLFQTHPDILALYQERFRYIMIDEYQDTNPMQYALASLLASKYNNLCVVGDDDQSIYGWRGAEVKHILEFNYDTLIKLEQNYRSSKNILEAANAVIQHNSQRHAKTLWSQKTDEYPLYVFHAPTEKEEAEAVVQRLINLRQELGYDWKDFAILYRSNQLSRCFESALMQAAWKEDNQWRRGIPYQVFGGTELYEKSEIKDLLAYLKVIANPLDQASLLRIINYPRRGISEQTLDLLTSTHRSLKLPLWHLLQALERDAPEYQELIHKLSTKAYPSIAAFVRLIEQAMRRFTSYPLHEALRWLVDTIDYKSAIHTEVKSEKMQDFKWDNIEECINLLKSYEEEKKEDSSLDDFLQTTLLDEKRFSNLTEKKPNCVNLLTFHSSKGLEFPVCFLVGLEDHLIPHEKSLKETGLEEERRLMYVALTRCKERLHLSMSRVRKRHGKEIPSSPSRFLFDIPGHLLTVTSWKP